MQVPTRILLEPRRTHPHIQPQRAGFGAGGGGGARILPAGGWGYGGCGRVFCGAPRFTTNVGEAIYNRTRSAVVVDMERAIERYTYMVVVVEWIVALY